MQNLGVHIWKVLVGHSPKTSFLLNERLQMNIYSISKKNYALVIGYLLCCTKISSITNSLLLYLTEQSKQTRCVMIVSAYILLALAMTKWLMVLELVFIWSKHADIWRHKYRKEEFYFLLCFREDNFAFQDTQQWSNAKGKYCLRWILSY